MGEDLVFYDELPDPALEVAAGKYWEVGNPLPLRSAQDWTPVPPIPRNPRRMGSVDC
jgi:hypothetical protein